jgi:hypothetical protein
MQHVSADRGAPELQLKRELGESSSDTAT